MSIRRVTELIGKTVMSATSGEKLGTVADVLLDDVSHAVTAFIVTHGLLKREEVLPAGDVQSFGRDAIITALTSLVGAREWLSNNTASDQK